MQTPGLSRYFIVQKEVDLPACGDEDSVAPLIQ
jgi:hypothetical protein